MPKRLLRPSSVRAAPEGTTVEDRDTGAGAPEVGASSASPGPSGSGTAAWQQRRPTEPRSADGQEILVPDWPLIGQRMRQLFGNDLLA